MLARNHRWSVRLLLACACGLLSPAVSIDAKDASVPAIGPAIPIAEFDVSKPGVFAVAFGALPDHVRVRVQGQRSPHLSLHHRGETTPLWVEDGGDGTFDPGDRLTFAVSPNRRPPVHAEDETQLRVFQLTVGPRKVAPRKATPVRSAVRQVDEPRTAPPPRLLNRLRFETDAIRAALTAREADIASSWFQASISHLASSVFALEFGGLDDRQASADPAASGVRLRIRLLGWSQPATDPPTPRRKPHNPQGQQHVFDHHVVAKLNGITIGEARWDGRTTHDFVVESVPNGALDATRNVLSLHVPARSDAEGRPLIDLNYVDWVEVEYPIAILRPSHTATRTVSTGAAGLPSSDAVRSDLPARAVVMASLGDWLRSDESFDAWLSSLHDGTEIWAFDPEDVGMVEHVRQVNHEAWQLPSSIAYLIVTTQPLAVGAERLAALHRKRGLDVAVVRVDSVYSRFGNGQPGVQGIRALLDHLIEAGNPLRYVLLLGDADWFSGTQRRDLVATGTVRSKFGPAASDHVFAVGPDEGARPRLAVGRIPVREAAALDAVVDKIERYLASPRRPQIESLFLSDQSSESRARHRRVLRTLETVPMQLREARPDASPPAAGVIEGFAAEPDVVHFVGHGGRFMWQLRGFGDFDSDAFFDVDDIANLPTLARPPIVFSMSCATAPFDHPSANSLGEAMLLEADSGAIAFFGASVRLHTPTRVSERLLRALLEAETIGDAIVSAKRDLNILRFSRLYNLLGDPALPLR